MRPSRRTLIRRRLKPTLNVLREWCADNDTKGILVVKKFPNHAKVLIRDDKYAVMGSFNWLSNAGTFAEL